MVQSKGVHALKLFVISATANCRLLDDIIDLLDIFAAQLNLGSPNILLQILLLLRAGNRDETMRHDPRERELTSRCILALCKLLQLVHYGEVRTKVLLAESRVVPSETRAISRIHVSIRMS